MTILGFPFVLFNVTKRAAWLLIVLTPPAVMLAMVLYLEFLSAAHRKIEYHSKGAAALRVLRPTEPGAWLSWWHLSFLKPRLHGNIPLVALSARWVATCRPNLASRTWVMRLWMSLREEEHFSLDSRCSARVPANKDALEYVHGRLTAAFGERWKQAMRLDPVAISHDCVVESYSAVLREDMLAESQRARKAPPRFEMPKGLWFCRRRRTMETQASSIAESPAARRAVVRVRRKDVAEMCAVDLKLLEWIVKFLSLVGLCRHHADTVLGELGSFVADQLDLRNEARLFSLCHAALPRGSESPSGTDTAGMYPSIVIPRLYGESTAEVLVTSFEDGVCIAERRRSCFAQPPDDADTAARAATAGNLARAFWAAALNHGILLGGLGSNNLLLRNAGCGDEQEVVMLRCGLAWEIDERSREDLRAFAECLAEGPVERLGTLILEQVHSPAGGAFGAVQSPDAFASGVRELVAQAHAGVLPRARSSSAASSPPWRGEALLQRSFDLAQRHGVCAGLRHLQLAAAVASVHGVCARLDPQSAGALLRELQVATGVGGKRIP
jgi:hypothetical protein